MKIEKLNVFPFKSGSSKTAAFVSAQVGLAGGGSIWLKGMTVVNGSKGLFLSFPQQKKKAAEGEVKYEDLFFFGKEEKKVLEDAAKAEYEKKTK